MRKLLAAVLLLGCLSSPALAQPDGVPMPDQRNIVRITFSPGGSIFEFIQHFIKLRESGAFIVIDGACISACTMILGLIDDDHVCVTGRAFLAFHSARSGSEFHREGTRLVWHIYPPKVREWLRRHGWDAEGPHGQHPELLYLEGDELRQFYRACTPEEAAQPATS